MRGPLARTVGPAGL